MSDATASIRELRLNFPSIRKKIEEHGSVLITDNGAPSFVIRPAPKRPANRRKQLPDYAARLLTQKGLSAEETEALHRENRGDC